MAIEERLIEYSDAGTTYEALLAWDSSRSGSRPAVMVSHAWRGRSDFENDKARKLAEMGYVGFALDVYGKGVLGNSPDENRALMQPLLDDRQGLQSRLLSSLEQVRAQEQVDATRIAAIGYCFGGLCVLDLARSGADVNGVVSFHGLFSAPGNTAGNAITAKVLALHGWDDPMAPPDHVVALADELNAMGADWQIHGYGGTVHAFTNPAANDKANGLQYDADADRRSWASMTAFLSEVLV